MIHLECPRCGKRTAVPDRRAGGVGRCPACAQRFRIPGALEADLPPSEEILDALPGDEDVPDEVPWDDDLDGVEDDLFWRKKPRRRKRRRRIPESGSLRGYDEHAGTKDALAIGGLVVLSLVVIILGGYVIILLADLPRESLAVAIPMTLLAVFYVAFRIYVRSLRR